MLKTTNFQVPTWEANTIGDNACKGVFKIKKKVKSNKKKKTAAKDQLPTKLKETLKKQQQKLELNKTTNPSPKKDGDIVNKSKRKNNKKKKLNNTPTEIEMKTKDKPVHKDLLKKSYIKESVRLKKVKEKMKNTLESKLSKTKWQELPLRERMLEKLKAARFRYLNEEIYTKSSKDAVDLFQKDPHAFKAYHEGYRQQVLRWPINPLDNIIKSIKKLPKNLVIADFGCGEARLAQSVPQKVHSFDFVASNENVIACDMSKVPLARNSVDMVVFCLSLMGTNLADYLFEANRVLKLGGTLKIAEVESRFDTLESFVAGVERVGFKNVWKDLSHNLFYFLDFKKESHVKKKLKLPLINLQPCLYKKR